MSHTSATSSGSSALNLGKSKFFATWTCQWTGNLALALPRASVTCSLPHNLVKTKVMTWPLCSEASQRHSHTWLEPRLGTNMHTYQPILSPRPRMTTKQQAVLSQGGAAAATAHPYREKTWAIYLAAKGIPFSHVHWDYHMHIVCVCIGISTPKSKLFKDKLLRMNKF